MHSFVVGVDSTGNDKAANLAGSCTYFVQLGISQQSACGIVIDVAIAACTNESWIKTWALQASPYLHFLNHLHTQSHQLKVKTVTCFNNSNNNSNGDLYSVLTKSAQHALQ